MQSILKREVGCFTADIRGEKVIVGGRAFPVGFFFTNSLNEYWKEAPDGINSDPHGDWLICNRILSTHLYMWNVPEDIITGYLDEHSAAKLHESIQYILRVIRRARPFRYLDMKAERERCDLLFGEESVQRINRFLQERADYALKTDRYIRPSTPEIQRLESEQAHLDDYISTMDYYYSLGNDMKAAQDFGEGFVQQVANLEKRDECRLILCAMDYLNHCSRWPKAPNSSNVNNP